MRADNRMARFSQTALGLLETRGLVAAIEAADAMMKTADVEMQRIEQTVAALITIHIRGEVAAVKSAIDAGAAAAERVGELVSAHVIARPADEVEDFIEDDQTSTASQDNRTPRKKQQRSAAQDLDSMTVKDLRSLARQTPDFPIQGRLIARANKAELLKYFRELDD